MLIIVLNRCYFILDDRAKGNVCKFSISVLEVPHFVHNCNITLERKFSHGIRVF